MTQNCRRFLSGCLCLTFAVLTAASAVAQSPPELTDKQKAVVAFDVRMDRLMAGANDAGIDTSQVGDAPLDMPMEGIKASDIKRVFGVVSLPDNIEQVMMMDQQDDLPMEFLVRIEFNDAAACQTAEDNLKAIEGTGTVEFAGKTYYSPPEGQGPQNLVGHRVNETTFQFATRNYGFQESLNMRTDGLIQAWKQVPDDAIRLAIDLETRGELIQQAVEMGKQGMPPMAAPFMDLIDNAKSMVISMDMGHDNLLNLVATGVDEDQAEELRSGLDSLLGMAKMAGTAGLAQAGDQMPEVTDVAKQLLDSLKATREGNIVRVAIPKPEGLGEAIMAAQNMAQGQATVMEKMNRFKQIALSIHNFHDAYRSFPFDVSAMDNLNDELSWRVRVLPFLEQMDMYDQMDMAKGPNEEPNAQFAEKMPEYFGVGGAMSDMSWIKTDKPVKRFAEIPDGTSNTIMVIENPGGAPG